MPLKDGKVRTTDERKYVEIIIGKELKGSPLEGQEKLYVQFGEEYKVDPLLAVAIAHHESNYCKAYATWHYQKYHNCAGIMDGGEQNGLFVFVNWEAFIKRHVQLLASYIYRDGRDTVSKIGSKYAPTSNVLNAGWQNAVTNKYHELWAKVEAK